MRYLIIALLLAGCAAQEQLVWTKTGVGNVSHAEAAQACEYDAQRVFNADIGSPLRARYMGERTYTACMKSKGWTEVPVSQSRPEPYTIYRSPPVEPPAGQWSQSYPAADISTYSTPVTITHPTPPKSPAVAPTARPANPIECVGSICDYKR